VLGGCCGTDGGHIAALARGLTAETGLEREAASPYDSNGFHPLR
jgi:hypothetical protein